VDLDRRSEKILNSSRRIPVARWNVLATLPTAQAYAPLGDTQLRAFLATLCVALLAAALTWWLLRRQQQARIDSLHRELSERKQNEARLTSLNLRAEALLKLQLAAESRDESCFMQYALEMIEQLTGSQIAFAHFVHDDQEHIEASTWSQATVVHYCSAIDCKHKPISQAGIWADALRQRAPVLINDYASVHGKHGLPAGHARLERLISVPLIESGQVRMMIGVGNKPCHYTEFDLETSRLVVEAVWRIVSRRRLHRAMRQRQKSPEEARQHAGLGPDDLACPSGRAGSAH
jgi:hypothetical protein